MTEYLKLDNMTLEDGIYHAKNIPDSSELDMPEEGLDMLDPLNHTSFWHKHRADCIVRTLENFMPPDTGWFADVGGGNGYIAKCIADAGYEVALFEPAYAGVMNAKNRGVKNIVWGLLDASTVEKGSISAIGLFDVLEHIENDKEFISSFFSLLDEKGKIIITVPAHSYLWSSKDDYGLHKRRYSLMQLKKIFLENDFDVVYETYFFSFLLPPVFFLNALPYKLFGKKNDATQPNRIPIKHVEKTCAEHRRKGKVLDIVLAYEKMLIKKKIRLPFGASILMVAEKT